MRWAATSYWIVCEKRCKVGVPLTSRPALLYAIAKTIAVGAVDSVEKTPVRETTFFGPWRLAPLPRRHTPVEGC